ncbi:hypothetical protein ES708_29873 [subsurface metagenome]
MEGGCQYQYENQDRQDQTKRPQNISDSEKDHGKGCYDREVYAEMLDPEGKEEGDQEDHQQDDLAPWIKTVDRRLSPFAVDRGDQSSLPFFSSNISSAKP